MSEQDRGPLPTLTRRRFLWGGLGAVAGLTLVGAGVFVARQPASTQVSGLKVLTLREYGITAAIARTLFPEGGQYAAGADTFDLARAFDQFLLDEPYENVRDLRLALQLVEVGPLLFSATLTPFSALAEEARAAHWTTWENSSLLMRRQVSLVFRKFFAMVFYDRPELWQQLGYDGPWEVP